MRRVECEFEPEVLAAALQSRWPDRVDADLRSHVAGCAICSEAALVAVALDHVREDMRAQADVPESGRVWWLAQLRARREAADTAARPITAAQVIALACAVGLFGACVGATSTWLQSTLRSVASSLAGVDRKALLAFATARLAEHSALALAIAVALFLVPTAVYLALGRD